MPLITIPEHVLQQKVADELVIVDLDQGEYYTLDPIGSRILELATERDSLPDLLEAMLEEYDATEQQLRTDTLDLFEDMESRGLVARP